MAEDTFGRVTFVGTSDEILRGKQALDECVLLYQLTKEHLEDLIGFEAVGEFHTSDEFRAKGYEFDDGGVNWGRVVSVQPVRRFWVNSEAPRPWIQRHIIRHEISHVVPLTKAKKAELLELMWKRNGNHPRKWDADKYEARPEECHADTLAEAMSGIDSPWDDLGLYTLDVRDPDVPKLMEITFR